MPERESSFQQQQPSVKGRNKALITRKISIKVDYFCRYLIALSNGKNHTILNTFMIMNAEEAII